MLISRNKWQRLFSGSPPMQGGVCFVGGDDPNNPPSGSGDPPKDPPGTPPKDPPGTPPAEPPKPPANVVTMTPEELQKQLKAAENRGAAAARRNAKKDKPADTPPSNDPQPSANIGELIAQGLKEGFTALREELSGQQEQQELSSYMAKLGLNEAQIKLLSPQLKGVARDDRDKKLHEIINGLGISMPKDLRSRVELPAIGPAGTRDIENVDSVFDLTGDELAKLGSRKVREMTDSKIQSSRGRNPLSRRNSARK